jgi:hypothetical protein
MSDQEDDELVVKRTGIGASLAIAGGVALVHGALWVAVLFKLIFEAPRVEHSLKDFGMKLPWVTEVMLAFAQRPWLCLALAALVLMLDLFVLFWLGRLRMWVLLVFWALLLAGFLFLLYGLIDWALVLPQVKLLEGLSR